MRLSASGLCPLILLLFAPTLEAKVFSFTQLDIQCEVPDSWIFRDRSNDLVNAVDAEHQKCFLLSAAKSNATASLHSAEYRRYLEDIFVTKGYNISKRETIELQGVAFYKISMDRDLGNKKLDVAAYYTVANGYVYALEASEFNLNPDDDPELQGIMDSFKFIQPPIMPSRNLLETIFTPQDGLHHDDAFLLGYRLIILVILGALLFVPVAVIAAIGLGIYFSVRSRKPVQAPPPSVPRG